MELARVDRDVDLLARLHAGTGAEATDEDRGALAGV
jgi:hypothetical protein